MARNPSERSARALMPSVGIGVPLQTDLGAFWSCRRNGRAGHASKTRHAAQMKPILIVAALAYALMVVSQETRFPALLAS
jgi:hypothetical protein